MTTQVRVRVSRELVAKAERVANGIGLDLGDLVKMALAAVVRENGIPAGMATPRKQTAPEFGRRGDGKG
jgi:addiction module RelB/DinJ family antitoxin